MYFEKEHKSSSNHTNGGIGFFGLLTIVFITLKLTGHINWSWFWVLSPIWIYFLLVLFFILIVSVFVFVFRK